VFSFIQLNQFMSARGYMFFLICLYIFAAAVFTNLGLCVWVSRAFQNNKFDHVW
jgi:NADH:ubiquinone oxidoreductase subunit K